MNHNLSIYSLEFTASVFVQQASAAPRAPTCGRRPLFPLPLRDPYRQDGFLHLYRKYTTISGLATNNLWEMILTYQLFFHNLNLRHTG